MSWTWAIAAGVVLGVIYTLSPLLVLSAITRALLLRWAGKSLGGRERDWFLILFVSAILVRYLVIGALVLSADGERPYTVFFGDEWIFKSRPIWMRNIGLGVPISGADFIYAFDTTGMSAHLYVYALLQALVGDAPYGVHLFNLTLYVGAVAVLYAIVRRSFGAMAALGGTAILLFMPSLFAWSISALKEPIFIAAMVLELLLVLAVARAPRVVWRVAAVLALVPMAYLLEELRLGTKAIVAFGATAGWAAAWALRRPWRVPVALAGAAVMAIVALAQPPVQARTLELARELMRYHAGHVMSQGVSYQIIDARYYGDKWIEVRDASPREVLRYMMRAPIAYVTEPTPNNVQSPLLRAYLPQHFVWLVLVALAAFGVMPALRRDRLLAAVLLAHGAAIAGIVALSGGNIGTLIRHRDLSLPYLVWFSMLGAIALLARVVPRRLPEGSVTHAPR